MCSKTLDTTTGFADKIVSATVAKAIVMAPFILDQTVLKLAPVSMAIGVSLLRYLFFNNLGKGPQLYPRLTLRHKLNLHIPPSPLTATTTILKSAVSRHLFICKA